MGLLANKGKQLLQQTAETGNQVLDVTANMKGTVTFQEPVHLRISGNFEGRLETHGDLTIGEHASVQADVTGDAITIAGRVTGKIVAKTSLRLVSPAILKGEVWTPVLEVSSGARLNGSIHMMSESAESTTQGSRWLNPEAVAEYLEMDVLLVEQWAREGKIPGTQDGKQWRFEKTKIDEWVAAQKSS